MDRLPTISHSDSDGRWALLRDVAAFQLKLALDALRDLVFSPLSLAAAFLDLVTGGRHPGRYFYRILEVGSRTEHWINLFGAPRSNERAELAARGRTIDSIVGQVEELIVEQYERGGLTASAKRAIDRSLDAIPRKDGG